MASSRSVPVPITWENGAGAATPPALTDSVAARITESMASSRADGTLRAYASAWRRFATWCQNDGHAALPAHPATVAAYLVDAADTVTSDDNPEPAYAPATLSKWVAAIAHVHRRSGHINPTDHEMVRATLSGIRRTYASTGSRPRKQMKPLLAEHIVTMITTARGLSPVGPARCSNAVTARAAAHGFRRRAAHARAVATTKGRRTGRPSVVTESQIAHAVQLRDAGATAAEIVTKTGLIRSTLYRHLPPWPPEPATVATPAPTAEPVTQSPTPIPEVAGGPRPAGYRLACPTCGYRPSTRQEEPPHLDDLSMIWLRITPDNRISEHRHCVRRQPHEQIMAISCERWVTGHWSSAPYHLAACPSRYAKL